MSVHLVAQNQLIRGNVSPFGSLLGALRLTMDPLGRPFWVLWLSLAAFFYIVCVG